VLGALLAGTAVAAKASGGYLRLTALVAGLVISPLQPKVPATTHGASVVRVQPQEPVTVLVLGMQQGNGEDATDSMLVLGFDPQAHTAGMFSVARDLWVDIPTFGYQRINTAMENVGIAGAELTVEETIGVPVEYYAVVDYAAFTKLVDDIGGINVDVPSAINDSCYPNAAETECTVFDLPAGEQRMDGETALKFVTERHAFADADIQRQADQQLVLFALKDALLQPQNLLKVPQIVGDLQSLVRTDLPYADLPTLAAEALQLPQSSIESTVPSYQSGAISNYTTSGGAEVLLPNEGVLKTLARQTFPAVLSDMDQMTVQVEDGVPSDPSAGADYAEMLQGMGVQTLPPTAAPEPATDCAVYVNTSVAHLGRGAPLPTEAVILGQTLGTQPQLQALADSQAQIVVVLGSDYAGASGPASDAQASGS